MIITIENTGSIVLTDVVIKFNITREPMGSPIVDQAGEDVAKSKLNISEIHQSTFLWSPSVGLGTGYTINVNVTALNFGKEISPVIDQQGFIIRDVDKDVGPVDYRLEDEISSSNGTYSNNSHQISGIVKNYANIDFSTSFTLSGSIYTLPGWQQIWNDSGKPTY